MKGTQTLIQVGTQQGVGLVELALGSQGLTEQPGPFAVPSFSRCGESSLTIRGPGSSLPLSCRLRLGLGLQRQAS